MQQQTTLAVGTHIIKYTTTDWYSNSIIAQALI
jgi:hypothetical protein